MIAVSNQNVLFHHQQAFYRQQQALDEVRRKMATLDSELVAIEVPTERVSVADAVATYLFNSQILTKPNGKMMIVVPEESRQHAGVWRYLNDMVGSGGRSMKFACSTCVKACATAAAQPACGCGWRLTSRSCGRLTHA